ncbi:MAG TPA: 1-(5-phosphoribosyl)-5-[(5-phosphoribosylamino)methylideneamino]imidazole-4-carboxamide isomerase [Xanthomonadaceae bacterium]|jgi:phosphoribosylformimino-5-aminoimidazole carboxamide ribotide isomerase|nr:1-(5-phosphoribosyl)-5-[(5-phosphoribosylamino)methylideneamino]imidazole-4-carboxamide isomerase [Xanthomonadaceae bacterium]
MTFTVYPAIDMRDGRVVRLRQGDYAQETRYALDPLALAKQYADAGAQWLHLVDLDAARAGGYTLAGSSNSLLASIKSTTSLRVQTGGGVRSESDVEAILDAGADRVVVGSLAVREPTLVTGWLRKFGAECITVALDARRSADGVWLLPSHGWTEDSDIELESLLARYVGDGLQHLLCTDIARDGMLSGPSLDLYRSLCEIAPGLALQASGGVRGIADVIAARNVGCAGVVLGKALLEGLMDLSEALAC